MNTIGKVLVILNFLFAVTVGVFLVLDVALRTQWKDAYIALKRETDMMHQGRQTDRGVNGAIVNDNKNLQSKVTDVTQKLADTERLRDAEFAAKELMIADLKLKLDEAVLVQKETLIANKRLTDEIALSQDIIKDREASIVKLEAESKKLYVQATTYQSTARTNQTRNEVLLEQVRELTRRLTSLELGTAGAEGMPAISDPNKPNPPAVKVKGVIEKVDAKDGTLVQISLGTDHGVNKNNTLDVFRTRPEAKYLGMIRIVEAYHHKSVGRLVGGAATRAQLKEGDQVASKIN